MKMNSWQKLLLFAAMTLLVLGVTACAGRAQAAPALQESPTAVPEEEAAPAETDAAETDAAETDAAEPAAAEEQATEQATRRRSRLSPRWATIPMSR